MKNEGAKAPSYFLLHRAEKIHVVKPIERFLLAFRAIYRIVYRYIIFPYFIVRFSAADGADHPISFVENPTIYLSFYSNEKLPL